LRGGLVTVPGGLRISHSGVWEISGPGVDLEGSFRQTGPGATILSARILVREGYSASLEGPLEIEGDGEIVAD
jgi:hypothetical protein